jgi:hypothetical protein
MGSECRGPAVAVAVVVVALGLNGFLIGSWLELAAKKHAGATLGRILGTGLSEVRTFGGPILWRIVLTKCSLI